MGLPHDSGGAITSIPGATGTSYLIAGNDFPGVGTYFLVEPTTLLRGAAVVSNEIAVTVQTTPVELQRFTVE